MRIALCFTLSLTLSLNLYALPDISTGTIPGWLYATHPDYDKKPDRDAIADGYYYQLIDLQTSIPNKTKYTHYIIAIANESGVQNASEVSVTFSPEFQHVVFHRISVIRDGAVINKLEPARIKVIQEEKEAGKFEYNGLKRAYLTLKDVRKGDRIDIAYSVIGFNPVFGNKFSDEFTYNSATAVCNYYKTIISTADRPLYILPLNRAPSPAVQTIGNTLVYSWNSPDWPTYSPGANAPSWFDRSPTVYITEYKNWAEVIDWGLNTFNRYHFLLPPALRQKIAAWHDRAKDNKDLFANIASRYVQNDIRYLGLEIGVNTHQPHPPAEVFSQGFGDCKDKALLLTAILREEGIPAFAALLSTDKRYHLADISPSPRAFDHAIVAIRRSKGVYTYIDPTNAGQRGELNDLYIPDYGYSLVLEEGETGLQPVNPGRINDYTITEQLDAKYYDSSHLAVISIYSGGAADDTRGSFSENSIREVEESCRKYYAALFDGIRQTKHLSYNDDSLKNEFTVREDYTIPQLWHTEKDRKKYFGFTAGILDHALPDPAEVAVDAPIALNYPYNIHYTLNISLPEDWEFSGAELHIKNDDYQFDFVPIVHGTNMSLHYLFRTFHDHIPRSSVHQYKEDYKNIRDKISFELYKMLTSGGSGLPEPAITKPAIVATSALHDWKACWPSIWLTFFFSLFFSRLFSWLNSRSEETLYAPGTGYPLGGWLVLLGVSVGFNLLFESIRLLRENYYSYSTWTLFGNNAGPNLQYLFLSGLTLHLVFIGGGAAVLYWFIKKRDIFPRMFLWYIGVLLAGRLLFALLYAFIPVPPLLNSFKDELAGQLIGTLAYAAIGCTFVLRSGQIKSTFLEPFRERIR